jgi:hypothetical protein
VHEFNDIYNNEIAKGYEKYELKRLSYKRKEDGERKSGVGRSFKLCLKNRRLMTYKSENEYIDSKEGLIISYQKAQS